MKTMTMEEIKENIKDLSPVTQECLIKFYNRKLNELPIIAGTYKTRTKWWGIKIKYSVHLIKRFITAMAIARNIPESMVDLRTFCGEDVAIYKTIKVTAHRRKLNPTLVWTEQMCGIIRNLIGSITMDLPKHSEDRSQLEDWLAFPPRATDQVKRDDPVLDDRIHPGAAILKGIKYWQCSGRSSHRIENTAIFALQSLSGIRSGEELSPFNFKLNELPIDSTSGKFTKRSDQYELMVKVYHKQNHTPFYYRTRRAYHTVISPHLKELLEPWTVMRVKSQGANQNDPVFPTYRASKIGQTYMRHRDSLASAMGLYSSHNLRPYSARKLFNRCLRLFPISEMQAIMKQMNRHARITDDYIKCMTYTAMRQSLTHIVDFNWENYDTLIGPEVHALCVSKALDLALCYQEEPIDQVNREALADADLSSAPDFDGLKSEHDTISSQLINANELDTKSRFLLMARKYEIENIFRQNNRALGS